MVKQVKSWEAEDGSLHRDKAAAARRDVESIVEKQFPPHSAVTGHEVTDWLLDNRERLISALTEYHRLAPPKPKAAASPPASKGPAVEGTQE